MSNEPFVVDGVWVPRAIVAIRSRYAVPLFIEIRKHCFEKPECWPSVRRLARACGCATGTVSQLTDQFHQLGVITKMHDGRHCLYRFAEGCWRRRKSSGKKRVFRKPSFPANCSVGRTEERIPFGDSSDKRERHKNQRVSLDASRQLETCNKRSNMIKSLKRWATLSPTLPDAERPHRLAMLDRAEAMLDDWYGRSPEDRRCYDLLAAQARAKPLDAAIVRSLRQQPRSPDDNSIGAILASQGWYHGDRIDQSSRRGACAGQLVHSK